MNAPLILLFSLALAAPCAAETGKWVDAHGVTQVVAQSDARGMDFDVYIRLQTGMSEGELLLRAGKPDSESVENFRNDIVKTYYYFPTISNPWITAITLRGGRIANIERTRKIF